MERIIDVMPIRVAFGIYIMTEELSVLLLECYYGAFFARAFFSRMLECFDKKHISIYILMMIGVIYSFTDMEFSKANYVLAFLFISKV